MKKTDDIRPFKPLRKLILFGLVFISFMHSGFCQQEVSPMFFDYLTIREGLSHNTVYCMLQDRHGYIWIGTQNGLNKYDGYTYTVYRSIGDQANPSGFIGKTISSLFEDRAGNLWVGTKKQGVNILLKGKDQFVNLQNDAPFLEIKGFDISSFYQDQKGHLWITTVGAGVLKYDLDNDTSSRYDMELNGLSNNLAFDLVEDEEGTIWVATAGFGINFMLQGNDQFELEHVNLYQNPDMNGYRKTLFLEGNHLWIGTEGSGMYHMKIKERNFRHFPKGEGVLDINSNVIRDIHRGINGKLYIATDGGGLNVYDEDAGIILKYTYQVGESSGINSNALFQLMEDRTGSLWIGTYNGGVNVYKINKTWFEFFTPTSNRIGELESRSILSLHQSKDGTIWIGTDGGGLNRLDETENQYSFSAFKNDPLNQNSLAGNVVKSIYSDTHENLWIGLFGLGLDKFNPKTNSFIHYQDQFGLQNSLNGSNVWSIAESENDKLWIGTIGGGLNVYDQEKALFSTFRNQPSFPGSISSDDIMVVFVDDDDIVWVGNADKGLDRLDDQNSRFIHYRHDPLDSFSISNDEVRAIFQDSRGDLWIGTEGGGLNRWLGGGHFQHYKTEEGLIANSVMGITEDLNGMIWVTTFRGISRLNPITNEILNFDFHTGQKNNQFNQSAVLTATDGRLFFGGINGLNMIRPEQVKEDSVNPKIIFTGLKVLNKEISAGSKEDDHPIIQVPIEEASQINLSYTDNSFSIDFAAIDYTRPMEHLFSYKMEGFDDQWQTLSLGLHSASYTNLDPGTFTFKVRHKSQEASIKIIVRPPFWKTIWFRLLAILLFAGSVVSLAYFVLQRRETAHKQRLLEAESQILQLQNVQLENQVTAKNSKLMFSAIQMAHKNEILSTVKQELKEMQREPNQGIRQLMRRLDREIMSEDYWKEFNVYFDQVDHHFIQEIFKKHPDLTNYDLRLCTLMRINLNTKEIASLLNISVRGVEKGRYRLKKRLGLSRDNDLAKYISSFQG
jgi:ligand-binding sensor domain-containing protein/DNA-binding CsgD family transcriptional regulator